MQLTDPIDLSQVHAALAMRSRAKQSDECIAKENAKKSGDNFLVFSIWISMPTIEENIRFDSSQVIGDRRSSSDEDTPAIGITPEDRAANVMLRELRFSDFEVVARLRKLSGLSADCLGNWGRLWRNNLALRLADAALPIAWVLEADSNIVGYLDLALAICLPPP